MIWPFKSRHAAPAPLVRVWMGHQARAAGMVNALQRDVAEHAAVVLVVHFSATAAWWTEQLDAVQIAWTLLDTNDPGAAILREMPGNAQGGDPGRVFLLHSDQVPDAAPHADAGTDAGADLCWHVAEPHCLTGRAERVDALASELGSPPPVHHASLDDPLLQMFGGEKTKTLMRRMGVADDEPIDNKMVSRSVVAAQQKVAAAVGPAVQPAESQEAWIALNMRGGA